MINKENEKILENVKLKISISNFEEEEKLDMKKNNKNILKIGTVACCMLALTTGVVFAKEIKNFIKYYFVNDALNKAAESGYVENVDMNAIKEDTTLTHEESGKIIEDVNVSVKMDEFLMNDLNLSTNFTFEFDDKIKEVFDLENLQYIFLTDLIVFDEENNILASNCDKEEFEKRCKQYNLNGNFDEFISSGMPVASSNSLANYNKEENIIKYGFDFQTTDAFFPCSKELNFVFTKIKLEKFEEYTGQDINNGEYLKSDSVILKGDWKINVKVPEKMYNRPQNEYKVVSVSSPDISVLNARATETGFIVYAILSNVKEVDFAQRPFEKEYMELVKQNQEGKLADDEFNKKVNEMVSSEDYREATRKFDRENETITSTYMYFAEDEERTIDKITHIANSRGEKFETSSVSTVNLGNNKYRFSGKFEMTNNDVTDKLTLTLIYQGGPVYIELEK